jgi:hypothetical protein
MFWGVLSSRTRRKSFHSAAHFSFSSAPCAYESPFRTEHSIREEDKFRFASFFLSSGGSLSPMTETPYSFQTHLHSQGILHSSAVMVASHAKRRTFELSAHVVRELTRFGLLPSHKSLVLFLYACQRRFPLGRPLFRFNLYRRFCRFH